jgi:hypothetical protein
VQPDRLGEPAQLDASHDRTREVVETDPRTRTRGADWGSDAAGLVASSARLRWRAPELALLLADQASSAAARADAEAVRLRAEVLAVFAYNQLGRGAETGGRAMRALRAAIETGEEATEQLIRVELAACAADASAPSIGLTVLQPVFGRGLAVAPTVRAAAMVTAADCIARLGGGPDVPALLTTADQLYDTSRAVEPDAVLLRRGVVHARLAAYHRRCGDYRSAELTALDGLALVEELTDGELDTGQVSGLLTLELAFALLDSDRAAEAVLAAQPVLRRAARPAGAPAACWLRLAMVSRVHLPAGRHGLARRLLAEAAGDAERNHLDAVLAECRQVQTQVHETCAEIREALYSLRAAYLAERRWRDTAAELRTLLAAEFGQPEPAAQLRAAVGAVLASYRTAAPPPATAARNGRPVRPVRARHSSPAPLPVPVLAHTATPPAGTETGQAQELPARLPSARLTAVSIPVPEPAEPEPAVVDAGDDQTPPSGIALAILEQVERAASHWRTVNGAPRAAMAGAFEPAEPVLPAEPPDRDTNGVVIDLAARTAPPEPAPAVAGPASADPVVSGFDPADVDPADVDPPDVGPADVGPAGFGPADLDPGAVDPGANEPGLFDQGATSEPSTQPIPVLALAAEPFVAASHHSQAEGRLAFSGAAEPAPRHNQGGHAGLPPLTTTNGIDRDCGRHRSDVAMADLLAEALFAYQNGRQSQLAEVLDATPPADGVAVNGHHRRPGSPSERLGGGDDVETPPMGLALPPVRASNSQVRWADLPSELVWREPGSQRRH